MHHVPLATNPIKASSRILLTALMCLLSQLTGCYFGEREVPAGAQVPQAPMAKKIPRELSIHGDNRVDNYYWIRDDSRNNQAMLDLLAAENTYTREMMAHTDELQQQIVHELANRLEVDDRSVPVREKDYIYYREFQKGSEHPLYLRKPVDFDRRLQVQKLVDVNELSQGYDYYSLANWSVSPGQDLLVFAEDVVGRRLHRLRTKNIATGEEYEEVIENTNGDIAWSNDNRTFYYVKRADQTLMPYQVFRHRLGEDPDQDKLVYEEPDDSFSVRVYESRSRDFVIISTRNNNTSEYQIIDASQPDSAPVVFLARQPLHEYTIHSDTGGFFIRTNWQAANFRLMYVSIDEIGNQHHWEEVIPAREEVLLQDVEVFENYLVINERIDGQASLKIINRQVAEEDVLSFQDAAYTVSLFSNPEPTSTRVKYRYSSFTTPDSVYEYDMVTRDTQLLKQDKVVGGFDPANYQSERLIAPARDGQKIPISLVYRKHDDKLNPRPTYIYAYGSYGLSTEPGFRTSRLSLLDRGMMYAIVHVRGGQEMGRNWYLDGKLLNKKNTFHDFIDATRSLIDQGYADEKQVFAAGGSAGGLLMGVLANEVPDLYRGIIAHVPFVDLVTTMLDESIPLTTGEFDEWGDPRNRTFYDYMLSYSPYDQVKNQHYPNLMVTTGLWDSQVQYFEPVKWVAKLRDMKLDNNILLLDVNMDAGHGGASDTHERNRVKALEYAFILDLLEVDGG
jgi:oligopeptidase B